MKQMRVRGKLITGFLIMAIVAVVVGAAGVIGLRSANASAQEINWIGEVALSAADMRSNIYNQRAAYRGAALKEAYGMHDSALEDLETLAGYHREFEGQLEEFRGTYASERGAALVETLATAYHSYTAIRDGCAGLIRTGADQARIQASMIALTEPMEAVLASLEELVDHTMASSDQVEAESLRQANRLTAVLVAVLLLGVAVAVYLAVLIARLIARPANQLAGAAKRLSAGDIHVPLDIRSRDELGDLAAAFQEMAGHIRQQAQVMAAIAQGDFTVSIPVRSQKDVMNAAINDMLLHNNRLLAGIRTAAAQVDAAAGQISQVAQSLAEGASEQAATVQRFGEAVDEIQVRSQESAELARRSSQDMRRVDDLVANCARSMDGMTQAMEEITGSSVEISKVIKMIQDIAFQTNILALNASVEAARAGIHGKGFAVVAEEVQNLAAKSAAAVGDTEEMISRSTQAVSRGSRIVTEAHAGMQAVAELAEQTAGSIGRMSEVAHLQSEAISSITKDISQISGAVQMLSAVAEETAASSRQMSAQSQGLSRTVASFKLRDSTPGVPGRSAERPGE